MSTGVGVVDPVETLRAAGTSAAAIAQHYDLGDDFFALWLGAERVYSCAWWAQGDIPGRDLATAQRRKLDHFARELDVRGRRVLDIGCGWGAWLERCVRAHGVREGVGLTLSASQAAAANARGVPGLAFRRESWVDHDPEARYGAIACIEATEHLASDRLDADEKVAVYRRFFARCAEWLEPDGRLGLQLICLDNVGHDGSRAGRGPASELIRVDIFPESMPASLSELVLGWEADFELVRFDEHHDHYARTFRAWGLAYRARAAAAREAVGDALARTFERYFAAGEIFFRRREHALYRVVLRKRPRRKTIAHPLTPGAVDRVTVDVSGDRARGASADALRAHYDVSDDFYRLWLGQSMLYTSGLWEASTGPAGTESGGGVARGTSAVRRPRVGAMTHPNDDGGLDAALDRKIDWFARHLGVRRGSRLLDVGCGWGYLLHRMAAVHGAAGGIGLTLSPAQQAAAAARCGRTADVRLEDWADHRAARPVDAITVHGAFEHFAREGSTALERVAAYRRFFARCVEWLTDDGRLGLETIAHDGAPDDRPATGRGPLGDAVLGLYPETICPQLGEIVLGFEPHFEVEILRADPDDFARTCRCWLLALRDHAAQAEALVGRTTTRRFRQYLVSSEVQFRTRTITNYRFILHRRPKRRW
jgi:cyclopropane-fatty-acyl-phospholipid synthase